jgi:putative transposase
MCYHGINRGNRGERVYHDKADYQDFLVLVARACERIPMRLLAWCLMPNHFHFVLWPLGDGDMSRWMQWLLTSHVRRYHRRYGTSGRIWQGRYKAFPIQQDRHLLAVLRYVERNPVRADLVERAEGWPWSSLSVWAAGREPGYWHPGPTPRLVDWIGFVNQAGAADELTSIRRSVQTEAPFGEEPWVLATAKELDLVWTLRGRGRPRSR